MILLELYLNFTFSEIFVNSLLVKFVVSLKLKTLPGSGRLAVSQLNSVVPGKESSTYFCIYKLIVEVS